MIRNTTASVIGFILGFIFGLGLVTFTINLINAAFVRLPVLLGSILGLIVLIGITVILILKIKRISSLVSGIIIGTLVNLILNHIGFDKITGFIGNLGI